MLETNWKNTSLSRLRRSQTFAILCAGYATSCDSTRRTHYPGQLSTPLAADAERILGVAGMRSPPMTMGRETHRGEATTEAKLSRMHD